MALNDSSRLTDRRYLTEVQYRTQDNFVARQSVYAFLRSLGEDRILVVLNGSDRPHEFARPIGDRPWSDCLLEDLLAGVVVKPAGSQVAIEVEAFGARVLKVVVARTTDRSATQRLTPGRVDPPDTAPAATGRPVFLPRGRG